MSVSPFKELDLFAQIADAIGGTLEEVYNMQERERMDLITVLGLEGVDYNANYQVSPTMERNKYRTRTVAKMERETEREVNVSAALEGGGTSVVEEDLGKDLNGNIITRDSVINSETKESDSNTGDKESTPNKRKTMLVVKHSTSSNSPDIISDLTPTPVTGRKSSSWPSKLSLKRKGRKSLVPETKQIETSFESPDQVVHMADITHVQESSSGYIQTVPSFLIQKLSSHSSVNTDMPGSSSSPSLSSNLRGKILSSHPFPVQAVLARHDLPLHQGQQVAGGGGDWKMYRGELDDAFQKISKFKAKGLVHAGTEGGVIWTDKKMEKWGKKSVEILKEGQELRRSTRKKKKSFSISDSVFVSGDWALSSEEEVGKDTPDEVKTEENDELPVKGDESEGEGESVEKKKRGGKRKLFSKNNDYMDDSAESGNEEESFKEGVSKKKHARSRKGLRRTLESLKKEGSLSDLCGD